MVFTMLTVIIFSSCENEKYAKPEVIIEEVGLNNSGIGIIGSDLHLAVTITAEGTIDALEVIISQEVPGSWVFDSIYAEFSGMKSPAFHKHIDIPVSAEAGDYNVCFIVTDMLGNETIAEAELEIQEPSDDMAPAITITTAPESGQTFIIGQTITISGSVSDDIALGGLYIGLIRNSQNLADNEVSSSNSITILHTHSFSSPAVHDFSASITVGAVQDNDMTPKDITGNIEWQSAGYYILVKCKDEFGGNWSYSDHFSLNINL